MQILFILCFSVELFKFFVPLFILHLEQQVSLGKQPLLTLFYWLTGGLAMLWTKQLLVLLTLVLQNILQTSFIIIFFLDGGVNKFFLIPLILTLQPRYLLPLLIKQVVVKVKTTTTTLHLHRRKIKTLLLLLIIPLLFRLYLFKFFFEIWLFFFHNFFLLLFRQGLIFWHWILRSVFYFYFKSGRLLLNHFLNHNYLLRGWHTLLGYTIYF
jgi:hypothetical protein